jgi:hypothetical protein
MRAETQLSELQTEMDQLNAGHEQVANTLRQKAQALLVLPREMRDAVLEQIYAQTEPIIMTWKKYGHSHYFTMPKDIALYMSSLHVGEDLAREAAEMFYKQNKFSFVYGDHHVDGMTTCNHWNRAQMEAWFNTDHYGSGLTPKDVI